VLEDANVVLLVVRRAWSSSFWRAKNKLGDENTWYSIQKLAGTVFAKIPKEKAISKRAISLKGSLYSCQTALRALTTAEAFSRFPLQRNLQKP